MNTCYNALDRHVVAGFGDRPCFHHYSPLPAAAANPMKTLSYSEVLWEVQLLAGVLRYKLNVKKGDRVIIYVRVRSAMRGERADGPRRCR